MAFLTKRLAAPGVRNPASQYAPAIAALFVSATIASAHDLDAQGTPMPTWLVVVGLALLGSVGGAVFLVLKNHRRSLEARRGNRAGTPPSVDTPSR